MPDETIRSEAPTYFANVVTMNLDADQMVMEFRQNLPLHRKALAQLTSTEVVELKPPSPQELISLEPVARVVLTFTAVRYLKQYLDKAFPMIEARRAIGK